MKSEKIADKVWKIYDGSGLSSYVYLVDVVEPTLIDLGSPGNTESLIKVLKSLGYEAKDIVNIVYTHLHFDHIGQPSKFENARFFASEEEINDNKAVKEKIKLEPVGKEIAGMKIIKTPGHTVGSICLWLPEQKILFSGDTIFCEGVYGRVDLETSVPEKMHDSLKRLKQFKYKVLCPGH